MEIITIQGQEYTINSSVSDGKYISLVRVDKTRWRELADNQANYRETDYPLPRVFHNVYCIGMFGDVDICLARIIAIAESQGVVAERPWWADNKDSYSTWGMMRAFCNIPEEIVGGDVPYKTNWKELADYAAAWLDHLLKEPLDS